MANPTHEVNCFGPPFDGLRATFLDARFVDVDGPCPQYVALSYCWGNDAAVHETYITPAGTLDARKLRIVFDILPQNNLRRCSHYPVPWILISLDRCHLHYSRL